MANAIDRKRSFTKDGETYWIEVRRQEPGWDYTIETDKRGTLDVGEVRAVNPWVEIERMFPEAKEA